MKIEKNYIIGLGIIGIVAAVLAYYFGSRSGKASVATPNEATSAASEIDTANLTYSLSTYDTMANKLYAALGSIFTDEESVYSVFTSMRTIDDIKQTIKAFGAKGVWPFNGTLSEWIYQEMSSSEISQINSIFSRNNINYSF